MRRTVKAWLWRWDDGHLSINLYWRRKDCAAWHAHEKAAGKCIPCTITYDDGKPKKRRRAAK